MTLNKCKHFQIMQIFSKYANIFNNMQIFSKSFCNKKTSYPINNHTLDVVYAYALFCLLLVLIYKS